MTPKYIKSEEPDKEFIIGGIRIVRIGGTIYLYTPPGVHPLMTRKFGSARVAIHYLHILKTGLEMIVYSKKSKWQTFKEWFKR